MSEKDRVVLKIKGVPTKVREQLNNIADHKGLTTNSFVKSKIHEIIESFPQHMREPFNRD